MCASNCLGATDQYYCYHRNSRVDKRRYSFAGGSDTIPSSRLGHGCRLVMDNELEVTTQLLSSTSTQAKNAGCTVTGRAGQSNSQTRADLDVVPINRPLARSILLTSRRTSSSRHEKATTVNVLPVRGRDLESSDT